MIRIPRNELSGVLLHSSDRLPSSQNEWFDVHQGEFDPYSGCILTNIGSILQRADLDVHVESSTILTIITRCGGICVRLLTIEVYCATNVYQHAQLLDWLIIEFSRASDVTEIDTAACMYEPCI